MMINAQKVKITHEELFEKHFENKNLAQAEFNRTLEVYNKVSALNPSYLRIARPVRIKDSTVYFDKLTTCLSLRTWHCKFFIDPEILYYVGYALAELHLALNANSFSLDEEMNIHGDFFGHNVMFDRSKHAVYIIDFSPSIYVNPESYSRGYVYEDLAIMINGLELKYPLHRIYLLARAKKNKMMSQRFLSGYEQAIGQKVDREKLCEYIIKRIIVSRKFHKLKHPVCSFISRSLSGRAVRRYTEKPNIMTDKASSKDYRLSHTQPQKGKQYDSKGYANSTAVYSLWQMERECLDDVINKRIPNRERYLDFACGTGRIIEALAPYFKQAEGLDISETMLDMVKNKNINAKFILGDLSKDKQLVGSDFDLITAFRFFLKAQDSLCNEIMRILAEKLSVNGLLVFNIHNSRPSVLALQNAVTNIFKRTKVPSKSKKDINKLVQSANLQIIDSVGLAIVPKACHTILGTKLWTKLDKFLSRSKLLQFFASDVIFLCQHKESDDLLI